MKLKHGIYIGIGISGLIALFAWAFQSPPIPVEVAQVRIGRFEQTIDEDGKTRVRERYVVSAPLAGRLARIRLKAGDVVRSGAALAVLTPSVPAMIDARTARELGERIGAAEANFEQARAKVARAEAALEQAQTDAARQQKLQDDGFVAAAALDQSRLAVRVQTKELDAARFAQDGAEHDVAQARAALLRAREAASARRPGTAWTIEAPVNGQVLRVLQESEAVVGVGTPLLEIADPKDLEIVIDVLSTERARIAGGARVDIDAGAGQRLSGRVRRIEPAAFTKVSALGVEEQRVNVIVDIASAPQRELGDQFRIDARIVVFERGDALIAPIGALLRDADQWAVFVVADGRAHKRRIKLGARTASEAWIEDGLAAAERVIVYPSDSVADGRRVKVVRGPG